MDTETSCKIDYYKKYITGVKKCSIKNPYVFITYGPQGSGKSRIITKVYEDMKLSESRISNIVRINIDEMIENDPNYRKPYTYEQLRKCAWNTSDEIEKTALNNECDVLMETTGRNVQWIVEMVKNLKDKNYTLVIAYPLVDKKVLIERLSKRYLETSQEYAVQGILSNMLESLKNLVKLDDIGKSIIYIYNNTEEDPKLLIRYQRKEDDICDCLGLNDNSLLNFRLHDDYKEIMEKLCKGNCKINNPYRFGKKKKIYRFYTKH